MKPHMPADKLGLHAEGTTVQMVVTILADIRAQGSRNLLISGISESPGKWIKQFPQPQIF
jgi:hypothetical protein